MVHTMDLKKMGLESLSSFEMQEIDGGSSFWAKAAGFAGVIVGQVGVVPGVLTLQPELVGLGATITGLSFDYIDKNC